MPEIDERFFSALGLIAVLLYLIPGIFHLSAASRQMMLYAAIGLVGIGIATAVAVMLLPSKPTAPMAPQTPSQRGSPLRDI